MVAPDEVRRSIAQLTQGKSHQWRASWIESGLPVVDEEFFEQALVPFRRLVAPVQDLEFRLDAPADDLQRTCHVLPDEGGT